MISASFKLIRSAKFQLLSMLAAACYIALLFIVQYHKTIHTEEIPQLLQVDEKIKKIAPSVTVGIHINSFPEFSFSNNNFGLDATVWFRFAKATESLDTISKFTFQNSKWYGDADIIYKSAPIIKVLDKDVLVCYHIHVNFMARLNHYFFPIGDHKLSFFLQNKSVTSQELVFVTAPENVTLTDNILVSNWAPTKTFASAGYVKATLNAKDPQMNITYPCAAFSIDFESIGARSPISLYFPLFILFFIMLISLVLNISDTNRLSVVIAGVPALVLFRLVIDSSSPFVGYITQIDSVYYLVVLLSLLILFLQTYIILAQQRGPTLSEEKKHLRNEQLEKLNAIVFVMVLTLLLAFLTIYFI